MEGELLPKLHTLDGHNSFFLVRLERVYFPEFIDRKPDTFFFLSLSLFLAGAVYPSSVMFVQ